MWKEALIFAGGVAVGSAVTFLCLKKRMDRKVEEETEDIRRVYFEAIEKSKEPPKDLSSDEEKEIERESEVHNVMDPKVARRLSIENMQKKDSLFHVEKLINDEGYRKNYNVFKDDLDEIKDDDEEDDPIADEHPREGIEERPYTISQEEFIGGNRFFDKTTLNYYDDGILEDEITEEIIEDIDSVVGYDSLDKFGEYEDDVVFVRNERLSTDYEVVRQYRNFAIIPRDIPD